MTFGSKYSCAFDRRASLRALCRPSRELRESSLLILAVFLAAPDRYRLPVMETSETKIKKCEGAALNEAIRLVHQGDREAFAFVYRSYSQFVRRVCLRMLRDPAEVEDAAQDVFLRVFLKINTFRGESAFSSWLYRLTTNVALMRLRKNKRFWTTSKERKLDDDPSSEIDTPDPHVTDLFCRIDLQTAIDVLPEGYKAAFILHDVHGYDHREIAAIFGYSIGNSKSQVHKARRRLRKLLDGIPRGGHLDTKLKVVCVN
jgi:RNA polymerase sigma-70 factor (ECF subfamily)